MEAKKPQQAKGTYKQTLCRASFTGAQVTWNGSWRPDHQNWQLDYCQTHGAQAWSAATAKDGHWIAMSFSQPVIWHSVILQGRGGHNQWVSAFKLDYSNDGYTWIPVQEGQELGGVKDSNTKKTIKLLNPPTARCLRLTPTIWNKHPSLRWDCQVIFPTVY